MAAMIPRRRFTALLVLSFLTLLLVALQRHYFANNSSTWTDAFNYRRPAPNGPAHVEVSLKAGNATLLAGSPRYIDAILDPSNTDFDRLQCSGPNQFRYAPLQAAANEFNDKYFFAILLHECVDLLPRLLGSVLEVIQFLGKDNCMLSIVEGRSDDGTYEVLKTLKQSLHELGIRYVLQSNDLEPKDNARIQALADLRNQALQPLQQHKSEFPADSSTVVFLNDVAACPDDILELIHQRKLQGADMTCAMDWTHPGPDPLFYDVWIARGMSGDTFFPIGEDGNWDRATELFWNDQTSLSRLNEFKPFQAFACWNGATAFTAAPILKDRIRFRVNHDHECFSGEPHLFCKDMWAQGHGKIAVVPTVNLQYTDEKGKRIKEQKGYVKDLVEMQGGIQDERITWQHEPPEKLKCMPGFNMQEFKPWSEGLIGHDPV